MTKGKKVLCVILGILPLIAAIGIQFILMIPCLGLAVSYSYSVNTMNGGSSASLYYIIDHVLGSSLFYDVFYLIFAATTAIVFIYWFFDRIRTSREKILTKKMFRVDIIIGLVILAAGLQYLASFIMNITGSMFPALLEEYEQLIENSGLGDPTFLTCIYGILLGPVAEEFVFRGVSLGYFKKVFPFWLANLCQAVLFGIYHMNIMQGIYTFCIGLFFGYIYQKGGSLFYSILAHMIFNFYGFTGVIFLGSDTALFTFLWIPLMIVFLILGCMFYFGGQTKRRMPDPFSAAADAPQAPAADTSDSN